MTQLRDPIRQQLAMLDARALAILPRELHFLAGLAERKGRRQAVANLIRAAELLDQLQRIRAMALGELTPEGPAP